ncbi:hypothetical protein AX14_005387 [Amanita brunnescens Koide BX004]|nr:hypothetical protein AX14_005387 [Amanita brunnescens Koide BX004]
MTIATSIPSTTSGTRRRFILLWRSMSPTEGSTSSKVCWRQAPIERIIRDKNGCTAEELVPPDDPATAQLFREAAVQHFIDVDDVAHDDDEDFDDDEFDEE